MIEEFLLGLTTVLVHGFSDNCEVDERVLKVGVIFVVSVGEHKKFDQVNEFKLSLLA